MPRDFDISPYFEIVKPTIVHGSTTPPCTGPTSKPLRRYPANSVFPESRVAVALFLKRLTKKRRFRLRIRK
jgi:hypothetical protein